MLMIEALTFTTCDNEVGMHLFLLVQNYHSYQVLPKEAKVATQAGS